MSDYTHEDYEHDKALVRESFRCIDCIKFAACDVVLCDESGGALPCTDRIADYYWQRAEARS